MGNRHEIIAEVGINHGGKLARAKMLIAIAKDAGADVAKFQLYDPRKILDASNFSAADWDFILQSELSFDQTEQLKKYSDDLGIEFMASAFDLERLGWLERLEVQRHKIASRSVYDFEYVEAVQKTGKPYLVSFGMIDETREPLKTSLSRVRDHVPQNVDILYCVSHYPTPLYEITLDKFTFNGYSFYTGFSDHTTGISASKVAMVWGASIIEKHITLDKRLPGPDQSCSIVAYELKSLCDFRDDLEILNKISLKYSGEIQWG